MGFLFSYLGRNVGEDDSIALEPPLGRRHLDIRLSNLPHTNSLSVTFSGEDDSIALEPTPQPASYKFTFSYVHSFEYKCKNPNNSSE